MGASAGSHVATLNIEHVLAFDDNISNIDNYNGLGLIDGILVCHYDEGRKEHFNKLKSENKYNVYALKDDEIMHYNGKELKII